MSRKFDLISELYDRTCKMVVSSPKNWEAFLSSACRNYKLRFDEQLLIFAQRPDATAVLESSAGTAPSDGGLIGVQRVLRSLTMPQGARRDLSTISTYPTPTKAGTQDLYQSGL